MRGFLEADRWQARMYQAGAGTVYPACTRMRLAFRSVDAARRRKAEDVWREANKRLGEGADPEALLYALAHGMTLGPHGVPWR